MPRVALCLCLAIACSDRRPAKAPPSPPPTTRSLVPGDEHRYPVSILAGESRDIVVTQDGVDVVVDLLAPDGARLLSIDSPNGRHGPEPVELVADTSGTYQLVVRPLGEGEPNGRYRLEVVTQRDRAATEQWRSARAKVRAAARAWLDERAGPVTLGDEVTGPGLARFDALAAEVRVLGLGEATHGSRTIAGVRMALTRRLVERHGVRVIGLEASASRMRAIDAWARRPGADADVAELERLHGDGWINRRAFLELAAYARGWNLEHPADPIALVGLDDQDNAPAREILARFTAATDSPAQAARLAEVLARIAQSDAQAMVFGPSDVSADDWRFLQSVAESLEQRRAALASRLGAEAVDAAIASARTVAQFAELNSGADGARSRDRLMAANLGRAIGADRRAVFLAHNVHVSHPGGDRLERGPTGDHLVAALGDRYAALATSFVEGGFVAQVAGDASGRLEVFTLAPAAEESIDSLLASTHRDALTVWGRDCAGVPAWLAEPQPMHWIGALFDRASAPNQWFRPTRLCREYDGVFSIVKVEPEAPPRFPP